jgi:hypothetical protein
MSVCAIDNVHCIQWKRTIPLILSLLYAIAASVTDGFPCFRVKWMLADRVSSNVTQAMKNHKCIAITVSPTKTMGSVD